ncbi:MAG: nicotinamide-nucleotide adenylyltransferase [Candidatus Woesearchaeota archaeon]
MILILGRFQPLHKGHMKVIQDAYAEDKGLAIVIGSTDKENTKENPFSAEERKQMIEEALKAENITADIFLVPDINLDSEYVEHLEDNIGHRPEKIITENDDTIRLFKDAGYDIITTPRHFDISATEVRLRIAKGEEWRGFLPAPVIKILEEIDGVARIKRLYPVEK